MDYQNTNWRIAPCPVSEDEIAEEYTADVVVVGLGNAGAPAVRAAAESGARVIGIEKMHEKGYNVFGRQIGHINSDFLAKFGIPKVDVSEFFTEWMLRSGGRANQKLIMRFCKQSGSAIDWLFDVLSPEQYSHLRCAYWPTGKNFKGTMGGYKFWTGTAEAIEGITLTEVMRANLQKARDCGAQLFFGTSGYYLEKSGNRVTGLIAKRFDGTYLRFRAEKGVILAAGDFGGSKDMCEDLIPDVLDIMDENDGTLFSMGRDGSGIRMGVWAGGRLEPRSLPTMGGNYFTPFGAIGTFGTLWLDENGKRWCNEALGDPVFTGFAAAQEKHCTKYLLFDADILSRLESGLPAHTAFELNTPGTNEHLLERMDLALAAGPAGYTEPDVHRIGESKQIYAAQTLEELADYLGLSPQTKQNFLASIQTYNASCKNGFDSEFGKDPDMLFPIEKAPFYAQPCGTEHVFGGSLCTVGGLLTDEYQNVLDQNRDPIPGLYCTGNCCGRRFGTQYSTPIAGVSIGICVALGRDVGTIVSSL